MGHMFYATARVYVRARTIYVTRPKRLVIIGWLCRVTASIDALPTTTPGGICSQSMFMCDIDNKKKTVAFTHHYDQSNQRPSPKKDVKWNIAELCKSGVKTQSQLSYPALHRSR